MSTRTHYIRFPSGNVISTLFPEYHKEAEQLSRADGERIYKDQTRAELTSWIKPGTAVYCVLRSVSSSGMSRRISFFAIRDGELVCLDHAISVLTHYSRSRKEGLTVSGCGMDMGFAVVYDFGRNLWPDGTGKPHGTRNGEPDTDGGYALKSTWI